MQNKLRGLNPRRKSNPDLWVYSQELWPFDHRGGRNRMLRHKTQNSLPSSDLRTDHQNGSYPPYQHVVGISLHT
jgi:hypothetical protein